jgi:predicted RNA-binding Zn ribbon-like protein
MGKKLAYHGALFASPILAISILKSANSENWKDLKKVQKTNVRTVGSSIRSLLVDELKSIRLLQKVREFGATWLFLRRFRKSRDRHSLHY